MGKTGSFHPTQAILICKNKGMFTLEVKSAARLNRIHKYEFYCCIYRLNGSYFLNFISIMELFNLQSKMAATSPRALSDLR